MAESKYLVKFCDYLQYVVSELCKLLPKENDFAVLDTALYGLIELEKYEFVAQEYFKFIYKYREIIDNRDEKAILELDLNDELNMIKVDKTKGGLKIAHFKKILKSGISSESKNNLFKHISILNAFIDKLKEENIIMFK